jgi:hypothetical protein
MTNPIAAARTAIANAMQRLREADEALAAYAEEAGPARQPVPGVYDKVPKLGQAIADEVVRHLRESQGAVRIVMGDDGQFQLADATE